MSFVKIPKDPEWHDAEHIMIESLEQYHKLINDGFELWYIDIEWQQNLGSRITLSFKKGDKKIIANGNAIDEYVIHLQRLYDLKKKKPIFVWVPDTNLYFDIEKMTLDLLTGENEKPIFTNKLESNNPKNVYENLAGWISRNKNKNYFNSKSPELFHLVCIINERNGVITKKFIAKEIITLNNIYEIKNDAKSLDLSIAVSFFYATNKASLDKLPEEMLVGFIIYDLKSNKCVCFNIDSILHYFEFHKFNRKTALSDLAVDLFNRSIDENLNFKSFTPFLFESPWLTPLAWITYALFLPIQNEITTNSVFDINISEFFTFGNPSFPPKGTSFEFSPFSNTKEGHATWIMNFIENKPVRYILRFDQSKGERLIHSDFEVHTEQSKFKLIKHKPLDLESVYNFKPELFVSIMIAGAYDSYFAKVIESEVKGITELVQKNPAFLYPLNLTFRLQYITSWIQKNPKSCEILEKLYKNIELTTTEIELAKKMTSSDLGIVDYNEEEEKKFGITLNGYIIRKRYKTGQIVI